MALPSNVDKYFLCFFRTKAYNATQLVMFMAETFNTYMMRRLVDLAIHGRTPQKSKSKLKMGFIDPSTVIVCENNRYRVPSSEFDELL